MIFPDTEGTREQAARIIAQGGLISFRTDTFYGLGANPFDPRAVARLKALKGRKDTKPILLLIAGTSELERLLRVRLPVFNQLAREFWPGPLTIIGACANELPGEITAGTGTVGVRLPDDEGVRDLVRQCGGALTATSANLSGDQPARTAQEVEKHFPTGIDLIINGGEVKAAQPSTVLDATRMPPEVIREGAISRDEIERVLQRLSEDV